MGSSRLYQKPYPPEFDFVSYHAGGCIPEFIKFNGDDSHTTWEHVSQYILQLGEASFNDALCVHLFSLSLTRTAFSWFSSLASSSILFHIMLVGVFPSLLNLMVMILILHGNMLVNIFYSWERQISLMLCVFVYFLYH